MIPVNEAVILDLQMVIKSSTDEQGHRLVEVEASNEQMDSEGDVILRSALLDSSRSFLEHGHFDIDHKSEIGHRLNIPDPERYVIGYPSEVTPVGTDKTMVKGEIFRNKTGEVDPEKYMYDHFWCSLNTDPPTKWRASIYGLARDIEKNDPRAQRHVVKSIDWKSLAFTRRPVNDNITGYAKMLTAKAWIDELKAETAQQGGADAPTCREDLMGDFKYHICRSCEHTNKGADLSLFSLREHYIKCRGLAFNQADLTALAMAMLIKKA